MGSDLTEAMRIAGEMEFQFALPHGERPASRSVVGITPVVSIRAPAWGATFVIPFFRRRHGVSIRAPAWGATAIMQWQVQPA